MNVKAAQFSVRSRSVEQCSTAQCSALYGSVMHCIAVYGRERSVIGAMWCRII